MGWVPDRGGLSQSGSPVCMCGVCLLYAPGALATGREGPRQSSGLRPGLSWHTRQGGAESLALSPIPPCLVLSRGLFLNDLHSFHDPFVLLCYRGEGGSDHRASISVAWTYRPLKWFSVLTRGGPIPRPPFPPSAWGFSVGKGCLHSHSLPASLE